MNIDLMPSKAILITDLIKLWIDKHSDALTVCRSPYKQVLFIPKSGFYMYLDKLTAHTAYGTEDSPIECDCIGAGYYCYATFKYAGFLYYFCDKKDIDLG